MHNLKGLTDTFLRTDTGAMDKKDDSELESTLTRYYTYLKENGIPNALPINIINSTFWTRREILSIDDKLEAKISPLGATSTVLQYGS